MEILLLWLMMAGKFILGCIISVVALYVGRYLLLTIVGIVITVIAVPLMALWAFGVQGYNMFMSWKTGDPCYGNGGCP